MRKMPCLFGHLNVALAAGGNPPPPSGSVSSSENAVNVKFHGMTTLAAGRITPSLLMRMTSFSCVQLRTAPNSILVSVRAALLTVHILSSLSKNLEISASVSWHSIPNQTTSFSAIKCLDGLSLLLSAIGSLSICCNLRLGRVSSS